MMSASVSTFCLAMWIAEDHHTSKLKIMLIGWEMRANILDSMKPRIKAHHLSCFQAHQYCCDYCYDFLVSMFRLMSTTDGGKFDTQCWYLMYILLMWICNTCLCFAYFSCKYFFSPLKNCEFIDKFFRFPVIIHWTL